MAELKPCPFCGKNEALQTYHNPKTVLHPWYRIECDYCGAKGPGSDRGDHVELWNRRADAGVEGKCECGLSEVACRDPLRRSCPVGVAPTGEGQPS